MLAGIAILALISSQAPSKSELLRLRAGREWLFNATKEREDSGYFDFAEGSPDGIFFPIGQSDRLYYCSLYVDDQQPNNDRFVITCWARQGKVPKLQWQIKLLPGPQAVHGTLLSHACASSFGMSSRNLDPKTGKAVIVKHDVKGFHPDRATADWKIASKELEGTQPLVHYHINEHGDPSLGSQVDLHRDQNQQFGDEQLSPPNYFVIPKAEIKLMISGTPDTR